MSGKIKKLLALAIFFVAVALFWPAAMFLAPALLVYKVFFGALLFLLFLLAYYAPLATIPFFFFLLPFSGLPSRALELGAHQAVIFLTLSFALGYLANRLVTGIPSKLSKFLKTPLLLLALLGLSSAFWTVLRFSNVCGPFQTPFFYDRVVNVEGLLASQALRTTTLQAALFVMLPALIWLIAAQLRELGEKERKQFKEKLLLALSLGFWPVLLVAFYQHFKNPAFAITDGSAWIAAGRASGGMSDPNALGIFAALFAPLALFYAYHAEIKKRIFFAVTALLALAAMTFSGSRSSLLLVCLSFIFYGLWLAFSFWRQHRETLRLRPIYFVSALFLLLLGLLFVPSVFETLKQSNNPTAVRIVKQLEKRRFGHSGLIDRRDVQWKQAWRIWKEYPLTGVGLGVFSVEGPNYNREAGEESPRDNAWNQYLTWGVELGVLGILIWLLFLFLVIKGFIKTKKSPEIFVLLSAFAVVSFFGTHLDAPEVSLMVGILLAFLLAETAPAGEERLGIKLLLLVSLVFLLFNAVYLFLTIGRLGAEERRERFNLSRDYGFYGVERWQGVAFKYRWCAPKAGLFLTLPEGKRVVTLHIGGLDPTISPNKPQIVSFYFGKTLLDTIALDHPEWREIKLEIFPWLPSQGLLSLHCANVFQPEGEMRPLGIAVASDLSFGNDFHRGVQGLLGVESLREGQTAFAAEGLAWQPAAESQSALLNFVMPQRLPFEAKTQDYYLYCGEKLLQQFSLPLDGNLHDIKIALPEGEKEALSLRADKLFKRRMLGNNKPTKIGIRVLLIGEF